MLTTILTTKNSIRAGNISLLLVEGFPNRNNWKPTLSYSTSALRSSSATITMPSRCSFVIVLLSFIGSIKASFLREGSTLSVAPRTAYHFTNNYADSSCSQLVNGHMEVRFANTTSFYSKPCTAQESIYGTVYQKEILAEFDKFESCTEGLVGR